MNRLSQPDLHPEAEALSAFAESALPAAERTAVLAHMAECSRCRQIVYLAQAAAGPEMNSPQLAPGLAEPIKPRSPKAWFPKWVWASTAALGGIGSLALWISLRPAPPAGTVAMNVPSQSAAAPSGASQTSTAQPSDKKTTAPSAPGRVPPSTPSAPPSTRPMKAFQLHEQNRQSEALGKLGVAPQPSISPAPASAFGGASIAGLPQTESNARLSQPAAQPGFANTHWHGTIPLVLPQPVHSGPDALSLAQKPLTEPPGSAAQPPMPPALPGLAAGSVLPATPRMAARTMNGFAALRNDPVLLPNGMGSISTASLPGRLLAIDPDGDLFLSRNAGKSWDAVPPQWTGKAREIRALDRFAAQKETWQTPDTSRSADSPSFSAAQPASAEILAAPPGFQGLQRTTPTLFRLVTDRHQTWVSEDGKLWRRQ